MSPASKQPVFFFDVDNTLLDNDRVTVDLQRHLEREVGPERARRYWVIFEQLRDELGYADYLGALQRYRRDFPRDPRLLTVARFLVNYPFANRLFPNSLEGDWNRPLLFNAAALSGCECVFARSGTGERNATARIYSRIPYLPKDSPLAKDYMVDMRLVVEFARESRREMMLRTLEVLREFDQELDVLGTMEGLIDINHNYVKLEEHFGEALFVHRKGAVRLRSGQKGLVPGSMGTASFVIEGRGNEHAFCSCAHGGGRRMSRTEATRKVTRKDYAESLAGVVCAHSDVLLDEAPEAYKDIRAVMRGQADLVKSLVKLKPVLSVKGR